MKTALVIGGSGGIGEAVVRTLCADGYGVVFTYCSADRKARELSLETGAQALCCTLADARAASLAVAESVKLLGSLYLLVNCAGVSEWGLFDSITDAQWENMRGVNLDGVFYACRAAVPHMLHQKSGSIINIGSVWGETGASCEVAYSATKAGVIGLTKALAKELAPSGITVNCVSPGAVETPMMARFSAEEIAALCEEIPVGRMAKPSEIADAVLFLARSAYITGQVLAVNGGLYI